MLGLDPSLSDRHTINVMMHEFFYILTNQSIFTTYFQEWTDNNLRWNKSEYGDVEDLRFPPSTIWTPDILMYNRQRKTFQIQFLKSKQILFFDKKKQNRQTQQAAKNDID